MIRPLHAAVISLALLSLPVVAQQRCESEKPKCTDAQTYDPATNTCINPVS